MEARAVIGSPPVLRPPEVEQRQAADQLHSQAELCKSRLNSASYLLTGQFNM